MKKIVFILMLAVFSACTKVLDTKPYDFLSSENYYENEAQLNMALNSVYATLASKYVYGDSFIGKMGLEADDGFFSYGGTEAESVSAYKASSGDDLVRMTWLTLYAGISRANLLLDNIHKAEASQTIKERIRGEALFLRAYFYFLLVSNYGEVPLHLTAVKTPAVDDAYKPASSVKEIYDVILRDMEEASLYVNDIDKIGHGGRVSKSAVWGVLGRVCLYMAGNPVNDLSKYHDAKKWLGKVIESGKHELNINYKQIFINYAQDLYDIKESIWEVEFWGDNSTTPYVNAGLVGFTNGPRYTGNDLSVGYAKGYLNATANLFDRYEDGYNATKTIQWSPDVRRDFNALPYWYKDNPAVKTVWPYGRKFVRSCAKFRREFQNKYDVTRWATPINFPLLRYADVLLMYAEADNEINGVTPESIGYVNHVRRRAYSKYENGYGHVSESVKEIKVLNGGNNYGYTDINYIIQGTGTELNIGARVSAKKVVDFYMYTPGRRFSNNDKLTIEQPGTAGAGGAVFELVLTSIDDKDIPSNLSTVQFREYIRDERSRELAFESLRKGDLVRWGILDQNMAQVLVKANAEATNTYSTLAKQVYTNYSSRDVLWPKPISELSINYNLKQNPDF